MYVCTYVLLSYLCGLWRKLNITPYYIYLTNAFIKYLSIQYSPLTLLCIHIYKLLDNNKKFLYTPLIIIKSIDTLIIKIIVYICISISTKETKHN